MGMCESALLSTLLPWLQARAQYQLRRLPHHSSSLRGLAPPMIALVLVVAWMRAIPTLRHSAALSALSQTVPTMVTTAPGHLLVTLRPPQAVSGLGGALV